MGFAPGVVADASSRETGWSTREPRQTTDHMPELLSLDDALDAVRRAADTQMSLEAVPLLEAPGRFRAPALDRAHGLAGENHRPGLFGGTLTLFLPRRGLLGLRDPYGNWQGHARTLELHTLPLNPRAMLNEPFDGSRGELLRFDLVPRAVGGTDLGMSWLHMLLDGSGSEKFMTRLDQCHRGERPIEALGTADPLQRME